MNSSGSHGYEKPPVYEYGVGIGGEEHRTGMTYIEAKDWIDYMVTNGVADLYYMIRRPIGEWEKVV